MRGFSQRDSHESHVAPFAQCGNDTRPTNADADADADAHADANPVPTVSNINPSYSTARVHIDTTSSVVNSTVTGYQVAIEHGSEIPTPQIKTSSSSAFIALYVAVFILVVFIVTFNVLALRNRDWAVGWRCPWRAGRSCGKGQRRFRCDSAVYSGGFDGWVEGGIGVGKEVVVV
jgi:hypothetical protein